MTASNEHARNALYSACMLRKKAMIDAKIAGATRDQGAPPDLIALADMVAEIRVIKHVPGIRAQKSIEL